MFKKMLLASIATSTFLITTHVAMAQRELPTIRACSGLKGLNYYWVIDEIAKQSKGVLKIINNASKGSLENIDRLVSGECDVAIIQSDSLTVADKAGNVEVGPPLYNEFWHLICNTDSGITRITQLNQNTKILIGEPGNGAEVTWTSFVKADPKRYEIVPHDPIGGMRAAGIVQQGRNASCMAVVTGLNAEGINAINESAKQTNNLRLIPSNDSDILKIKDPKGHYVYIEEIIPSGIYSGGLQPKSIMGSSVKTVAVTAVIAASTDYLDKHNGDYEKFLAAVRNAIPNIKAHVVPH